MRYGTTLSERRGNVAILRLNRPDRLNAYTPEMGEDLVDGFRTAAEDEAVRAIILTGTGRAFCAGADRDCLSGVAGPSGLKIGEEAFVRDFAAELAAIPKLTIAAFNGASVGIGITMSLCLDLRLAVPGATLRLNFAELGILPGLGSTALLPRLIGLSAAKKLLLCEPILTSEAALRLGLIDEVVEQDALLDRALALGESAAACPAPLVAAIKARLDASMSQDVAAAVACEQVVSYELRSTGSMS